MVGRLIFALILNLIKDSLIDATIWIMRAYLFIIDIVHFPGLGRLETVF